MPFENPSNSPKLEFWYIKETMITIGKAIKLTIKDILSLMEYASIFHVPLKIAKNNVLTI
jgi:hypothetical protein